MPQIFRYRAKLDKIWAQIRQGAFGNSLGQLSAEPALRQIGNDCNRDQPVVPCEGDELPTIKGT
ncbi:hypothetical protein [Siminovitchia terrae]|uniref:hypothetical protein n=1 Tax=Siminovitchia terrae TaxID=1914933 RepID=UPI001BB41FC3|nr:hypothetical protein [Siminovitchia terrae]